MDEVEEFMKEKERHIISHLRRDARTSLAAISDNVQMPISTIYDKINRLQKEEVIKGYTTIVDFPKLGFHYHAKLAIKVNGSQKKEITLFLQKHPAVNSLHEINGGFDFLLETVHKDIKEYLFFIQGLKDNFEIMEMNEYQVIDELAREKFL